MTTLTTKSRNILEMMAKLLESGDFIGKGGNVVIAATYNKTRMVRLSDDIDCAYRNTYYSDDDVKDKLQNIFKDSEIKITRSSAIGRTLQIEVDKIPIDIEVDKRYKYVSEFKAGDILLFPCVTIDDILADKLSVITSKKVFRRSKDIVDVYNIITTNDIRRESLNDALANNKRELGTTKFLLDEANLKHAYDLLDLRCDSQKEDYYRVIDTLLKFLDKNDLPIWRASLCCWAKGELSEDKHIISDGDLSAILNEDNIAKTILEQNSSKS